MDQCLHLWKYTGGFEAIDQANKNVYTDEVSLIIPARLCDLDGNDPIRVNPTTSYIHC